MALQTGFFVINKESDYLRSGKHNVEAVENRLLIEGGFKTGIFYSRIFDSREKENVWHRLVIKREPENVGNFNVTVYSSEADTISFGGEIFRIEKIIADESMAAEKKDEIFAAYEKSFGHNPSDMLLHMVKGRYLWIRIVMYEDTRGLPFFLSGIRIYYTKNTFLKYLPDIYSKDLQSASFTERYLGIFQNIYQDMSEQIYSAPGFMQVYGAKREELIRLSEWLGFTDSYVWSDEKLKWLIMNAAWLNSVRGTRQYIEKLVEIYTGTKPYIAEYEEYCSNSFMTGLYGENPFIVTIIIESDGVKDDEDYRVLCGIVQKNMPVCMEAEIIVLNKYILLGKHSYLGINSYLSSFGKPVLDGKTALSYTNI